MISNVLTVCQGNVCRSPMAAALLQQKIEGVHVHSCGLAAMVGQPAASNAVAVLSEVGVDMREHRARQLTWQLASRADLILTMTARQKQTIESLFPVMCGRIFPVRGFDHMDIDDPMGLSLSAFRQCRESLTVGIDYWVERLGKFNVRSADRHRDDAARVEGVAQ
ncbi:arsenate reductase/protein-tyrosine-phosphatase family protein [Paraburkholderia graminis]|uniref:arsenate reductase/protein-tyrosine-phosphatase family protein n=1 Tax=Paraburkholderia graminis TaxID=60548 RepID=UPI0038BC71EF